MSRLITTWAPMTTSNKPFVSDEDINNIYGFHPATPVTGPLHDLVRTLVREMAHSLNEILPEGPTKTHLLRQRLPEIMWAANSAIACDTPKEVKTDG